MAAAVLWILGNQALHHVMGGGNDACGEHSKWDLLLMGLDDVFIVETIVVAM